MKITKKSLSVIVLFAVIFSVFGTLSVFNVGAADEVLANPSGEYLKFTVDVKKPEGETLAFAFLNFKKIDYVIQAGDTIEYDVNISLEEAGWGAVDGNATTTTGNLRDTGATDTDMTGITHRSGYFYVRV